MNTYNINISEFNSAGIKSMAAEAGITHMREIGGGQADGREGADNYVAFYALPDPNFPGAEILVANTNGDPAWQESDPSAFAELAQSCGVDLQ